jgi:hypothetical protein
VFRKIKPDDRYLHAPSSRFLGWQQLTEPDCPGVQWRHGYTPVHRPSITSIYSMSDPVVRVFHQAISGNAKQAWPRHASAPRDCLYRANMCRGERYRHRTREGTVANADIGESRQRRRRSPRNASGSVDPDRSHNRGPIKACNGAALSPSSPRLTQLTDRTQGMREAPPAHRACAKHHPHTAHALWRDRALRRRNCRYLHSGASGTGALCLVM